MDIECSRNIRDLHVFIESWLKASIEKSKDKFKYFEDQLDENFIIISPDGKVQSRMEIVSNFWSAYGLRSKDFKIEIRNIIPRYETEQLSILNYVESQTGSEESERISTVVFKKSRMNNKNTWLHLHETWCPDN